jgi:hypothetical protein
MRFPKICSVLLLSGLMLGCAGTTGPVRFEETKGVQSGKIRPAKYEEVELVTSKGNLYKGKIVSLEAGRIEFRPFPYWDVDPVSLDLGEIRSIELLDKPKRAGRGFIQGFGWSFSIVGGIAAMSSKYDEDYQSALLGSAIIGAAGGLLGFVIGAVQDSAAKTKFEFAPMSDEQKERTVRKIMGRQAQR